MQKYLRHLLIVALFAPALAGAGMSLTPGTSTHTHADANTGGGTLTPTSLTVPSGTALPANGGASLVLVTPCTTASASSYFLFDNLFSSTYDEYEVHIYAARPTTDATALRAQMGTGAGPTYDTGANYTDAGNTSDDSGVNTPFGAAGRNFIELSGTRTAGNATTKQVSARIVLSHPLSAAFHKTVRVTGTFVTSGATFVSVSGSGKYSSITAVTGLRVYFGVAGTNTIAEGTACLYGVRKQ